MPAARVLPESSRPSPEVIKRERAYPFDIVFRRQNRPPKVGAFQHHFRDFRAHERRSR